MSPQDKVEMACLCFTFTVSGDSVGKTWGLRITWYWSLESLRASFTPVPGSFWNTSLRGFSSHSAWWPQGHWTFTWCLHMQDRRCLSFSSLASEVIRSYSHSCILLVKARHTYPSSGGKECQVTLKSSSSWNGMGERCGHLWKIQIYSLFLHRDKHEW